MIISLSFLCLVARFLILAILTFMRFVSWPHSILLVERPQPSQGTEGSHQDPTPWQVQVFAALHISTDSQTCHGPPAHSCHSSSQHYPLPPSKYSGRLWRDRCWYIPYSIVLPKPDGLLFDHEVCLKTNTSCTAFNCIYLKYAVNFIKPCLCLVGLTKRGKTFSYS